MRFRPFRGLSCRVGVSSLKEGMRVQHVGKKVVAVRVPTALGDRLEQLAQRENNHVSAVTRRLLTKALDLEDAARQATRAAKRGD